MLNFYRLIKTTALAFSVLLLFTDISFSLKPFPEPRADKETGIRTALFAGGCFWGVEGVFERLKGVVGTETGYSGGSAVNPTYEMVSSGLTGHAETVKITYDPSVIKYGTLLKVFFSIAHDPTEINRQGPDFGTQYRSIIFYTNPMQKSIAEDYIKTLNNAKIFSKPIATKLETFSAFYKAEDYHQHFMDKNPDYPYIEMWDKPKIEALTRTYPELIK